MNKKSLDGFEHGSTANYRSSRSKWLIVLACMWMTFPLLASPIIIDSIDTASAAPEDLVTLFGWGFTETPAHYVAVVVGSSPPAAVVLRVESIEGTGTHPPHKVKLRVGAAETSFHGDLVILEGDEIEFDPETFQIDDRVFAVAGSQFLANSCQHLGDFEIDLSAEGPNTGSNRASRVELGLSASQKLGEHSSADSSIEPTDSIWAQPVGNGLELPLAPYPFELIYTNLTHLIDPEDCGSRVMDVSPPGHLQLTYLSGQPNSTWEFGQDLATAMGYAFQGTEGISVHFGGSWVTVELGHELRGSSILLEVFSSD